MSVSPTSRDGAHLRRLEELRTRLDAELVSTRWLADHARRNEALAHEALYAGTAALLEQADHLLKLAVELFASDPEQVPK